MVDQIEFKNRIRAGYGLVITGFETHNEEIDIPKHWSQSFVSSPPIIIARTASIADGEIILSKVQKIKDKRTPFLLHIEYTREEIWRAQESGYPDSNKINSICFLDRLKSICEGDCYNFQYTQTLNDIGEKPLTPIEKKLSKAMMKGGLAFETQVKVGRYFVDFLVESNGKKLIVEADGLKYHVPAKDAKRDKDIKNDFKLKTIRFGGSLIHRNAPHCVKKIKETLDNISTNTKNIGFEDFDQLDDSQVAAINHGYGSARIVAPAGSGKTKVLINRVVKLINRGVDPNGILCLAFNKDAADQLAERLTALGVSVKKAQKKENESVTVATFNALGLALLQKNGGIRNDPLLEKDERALAEKVFAGLGIELKSFRGHDHWEKFFKALSRIKSGLSNPLEEDLEIKISDEKIQSVPLEPIFRQFEQLCFEKTQVSFDGQIYVAILRLLSDHNFRNEVQDSFSHIIVDEFQDLSHAQIGLLRLLAAKESEVYAVGDDDQLIYSWRHVDTKNILNFEQYFPSMATYPLSTNYRCAKTVIDVTKRLIKYNLGHRIEKEIQAFHKNPLGSTDLFCSDKLFEQLNWIVKNIKKIKKRDSASYSSFAILTRYNAQQFLLAYALDKANIPRTRLRKSHSLYKRGVVNVLLSYITIINDPANASALRWTTILNQPNRYLTNAFLKELGKRKHPFSYLKAVIKFQNRSHKKRSASDEDDEPLAVKYNGGTLIKLPKSLGETWRANHLEKLLLDTEEITKKSKSQKPAEIIEQILDRFKFSQKEESKLSNADDLADDLILSLIKEDSRQFNKISEFLDYSEEQILLEERENQEDNKEKKVVLSAVTISSIHTSKGKEWDNVIIFDEHDTAKIKKKTKEDKIDSSKIEERRVFYVAMTRARLNLLVTGRSQNRSRFIEEAFVWKNLLKEDSPKKVIKENIVKLKNDLEKQQRQLSETRQRGNHFLQTNLEKQETESLKKLALEEALMSGFELQTGSIIGQIFTGKASERSKQLRIASIESQLERTTKEIEEIEINLIRDISGEEKLIESEITNLKTKVTKFKNMQQVLLKLYDSKLEETV